MSFLLRTIPIAHDWVKQCVVHGNIVVDATVGNGHDTAFLAGLVGESGRVIGFDIQPEAIERTQSSLEEKGLSGHVELHAKCHSQLDQYLTGGVAAAMFNLGYLPNGDKSIITKEQTTLEALQICLENLQPKGIITIMCYPGHEGGLSESSAVEEWAQSLETPTYLVMRMSPHNSKSRAPYLIAIQRN